MPLCCIPLSLGFETHSTGVVDENPRGGGGGVCSRRPSGAFLNIHHHHHHRQASESRHFGATWVVPGPNRGEAAVEWLDHSKACDTKPSLQKLL
eukprot:gene5033-biopygen12931